ncbi:MAG: Ig-like domain-containing protein [Flavitalea sp.]
MKRNSFSSESIQLRTRKGYSSIFSTKWFMLLMLVVLGASCKKVNEDAGMKGICPEVILTSPIDTATGVALSGKIDATFNEAMDPSTITTSTFKVQQGANAIPGSVSYTGTMATFTPSASLDANTNYTATITTGSKDPAGNALVEDYVWSFTTGAAPDVTPPTVISTDPLDAATAVPIDEIITASWSEAMDPLTITTATFTIKDGATTVVGTVTYAGGIATFSPSSNLAFNTTYTATITTGSQDLGGNALANEYVWTFTTAAAPDVIPPTVISTDPLNGSTNVALNKQITATFSELMNSSTITTATFTLKDGATPVGGTVTYVGTTATFSPSANLTSNTTYTATITTGSQDAAGNALAADYVWSFTTGAVVVPPNILGNAAMFGVFGGNAGITNQGLNTVINNGSIGTTAASTLITGFHDGTTGDVYTETPMNVGNVTGRIYTAPPAPGNATSFAIASAGLLDANNAYNSISPASKPGGTDPGAGELGGLTLPPGVYKSASGTFNISNGNLTLDAMGDPNAEWIFQTAAGLTVGIAGPLGARSVTLINGALAKNVYWHVGSAATINGAGGGVMVGNIIASAGVTFSTAGNAAQTVLDGRALSLNASVTLVNTTINVPN